MNIKQLSYPYGLKSKFPKGIIINEDASQTNFHKFLSTNFGFDHKQEE